MPDHPGADTPGAVCPVDHKTREAWLQQAAKSKPQASPLPTSSSSPSEGCDSSQIDQSLPQHPIPSSTTLRRLATEREVSSIPRAVPTGTHQNAAEPTKPANSERDTGADKKTGNWIYPSEQMFFDAMKRKAYNPNETDMRTIVPIHNAVNERAWKEIKEWEKGRGAEA